MYAADVFGILDKSTVLDAKNVWSPLHSFSPFSSNPSLGMFSPRLSLGSVYHLLPVSAFALTVSSYKQVCEWNLDYASIRRCIRWVLEKLGKYSEAIEEYEKAYKELPQDKDLLIRKGICLLILGKGDHNKYKEAIQAFDVIIDIDPTNWNAWRSKGVAFEELREYERSLDAYNRAIQLLSTNRGLFRRKAEVLTYALC